MPSITYGWEELEPVAAALWLRGYSYVVNSRGLTIEWDDPNLSEGALRVGIAGWLREDAIASSLKVSSKPGAAIAVQVGGNKVRRP